MTTTADEAALLHAIRLHPAEDTPRLAYADWLDENATDKACYNCRGKERVRVSDGPYGYDRSPAVCDYCDGTGQVSDGRRERAEFIRVQIAANRGEPIGSMTVWGLLHMSRGWFDSALSRVQLEWGDWGVRYDNSVHYESKHYTNEVFARRGFVFEVRMPLAAFLAAAPGLFATHPIERVVLTDREPEAYGYETFWRWFVAGLNPDRISTDPSTLPDAIWRLFHDHPLYSTNSIRRTLGWEFASRDEAVAALSAACVAYGRGLAGLPV